MDDRRSAILKALNDPTKNQQVSEALKFDTFEVQMPKVAALLAHFEPKSAERKLITNAVVKKLGPSYSTFLTSIPNPTIENRNNNAARASAYAASDKGRLLKLWGALKTPGGVRSGHENPNLAVAKLMGIKTNSQGTLSNFDLGNARMQEYIKKAEENLAATKAAAATAAAVKAAAGAASGTVSRANASKVLKKANVAVKNQGANLDNLLRAAAASGASPNPRSRRRPLNRSLAKSLKRGVPRRTTTPFTFTLPKWFGTGAAANSTNRTAANSTNRTAANTNTRTAANPAGAAAKPANTNTRTAAKPAGAAANATNGTAAKPAGAAANATNGTAAKPAGTAANATTGASATPAAAKPANVNNYTTQTLSQLIALSKKSNLTQNQKGMLEARISSAIEEHLSAIPGYEFSARGGAWRKLRATVPKKHPKYDRIIDAIKSEIRLASTGNAQVAGERLRAFQRNLKLSHSMLGNLKGNLNINKEFEAVFRRIPKKNGGSMIGGAAMSEENLRRKRNNENRRIRDEENRRKRRRNEQERRRNEQEERNMYRRFPSSSRGGGRRYEEEEFFGGGSATPRTPSGSSYRPMPNSPPMVNMGMLPQNQQTAINSVGGPVPASNTLMLGGGSNAVALAADAVTQAGGNVEVAKMYNPNIPVAAMNAVSALGGPQNAARVMNGMATIASVTPTSRNKKVSAKKKKVSAKKKKVSAKGMMKKGTKAAPVANVNAPPLTPIPRPEVISMLMKAIPKGKLEKIASVQVFGTTKNNLEAKVKALALGTNKAKRFPEKK